MTDFNNIQINSSLVEPGDAFFAIRGYTTDGHKFVKDAAQHGAAVIYVEHLVPEVDERLQVVVADTRKELAKVAASHNNNPTQKFNVVGITGTNGKTTITNICNHVAMSAGKSSAVIGTIGVSINGKVRNDNRYTYAGRTTPESFQLQQMFAHMVEDGVDDCFMEVSSHALFLNRTLATNFAVTAYTNLTQDHLDFHKTMEAYFEAKALLFGPKYPSKRVICIDDKHGKILAERCIAAGDDVVTCGFSKEADLNPENTHVDFPLVGRFNIQNMLVAYGICKQLGFSDTEIVKGLQTMENVPGRMELVRCSNSQAPQVVVDYAHTPDALENCIRALKNDEGNLICVFGCGGDRDAAKRPIMGKISQENADFSVVTTDNPRTEKPSEIINQILGGMHGDNFVAVEDRQKAIGKAIAMANPNDTVLIAGKGHEKTQEINHEYFPFDDVEIARHFLEDKTLTS